MLERKKLFAGLLVAFLSLNLCGSTEAATSAEKEEARMWGGFRDKVSCTVDASVVEKIVTTKETVIVKEVPVYPYPFLFIWDDWYHWHHHHHHVWYRHPRPPRPHIGRPPVHRPSRPSIVRPAPRPGKPSISRPVPSIGEPQIVRPSSRPNRPAISKPSGRTGGNRPVMRPAPAPRPQVKSAPPRSRGDEMIWQNGGARGGGRQHGGARPGGRAPRGGR